MASPFSSPIIAGSTVCNANNDDHDVEASLEKSEALLNAASRASPSD